MVVQAPELLALATAFRGVVAAIDAAQGYDGAMNVRRLFSSYDDLASAQAWVDQVGNKLLRVTDPGAVANSRAAFVTMVETGKLTTAALRRASTPPSAALDPRRALRAQPQQPRLLGLELIPLGLVGPELAPAHRSLRAVVLVAPVPVGH